MATKKYLSLERLTEYDGLIKGVIADGDEATLTSAKSYAKELADGKSDTGHTHDDRYYTETEIDSKISTVNESISKITSGTTVVKEAEHATSADTATNATNAVSAESATKATQDGDGKVISSTYETKTDATAKLDAAKEYTDDAVANLASTTVVDNKISAHNTSTTAHSDIRDLISALTTKVNNFLDVDDTTTDQLSEVLELIENNKGTLESLTSGKVNVSDIVNNLTTNSETKVLSAAQGVAIKALIDALQKEVNGKANAEHEHEIADVTGLQTALNAKVAQSDLDSHTGNTTVHITASERTNWNTAYNHSQAAHAPSDAEKNQNAFSNITVGSTTIEADSATDTITLVAGANVTITPDATNDKITIAATDTVYTHPTSGVTAGTYKSVTVDANGHVTAGTNPTTLAGYGITDAASKTHTHAIADVDGLNTALSDASSAISANTSSISAHTDRLDALEEKVGDGFEAITSEEISALFA